MWPKSTSTSSTGSSKASSSASDWYNFAKQQVETAAKNVEANAPIILAQAREIINKNAPGATSTNTTEVLQPSAPPEPVPMMVAAPVANQTSVTAAKAAPTPHTAAPIIATAVPAPPAAAAVTVSAAPATAPVAASNSSSLQAAATAASTAIANANPFQSIPCTHCATILTLMNATKCRVCARNFCAKCAVTKSPIPCPSLLIHEEFRSSWPFGSTSTAITLSSIDDRCVPVCLAECLPIVISISMDSFRRQMNETLEKNYEIYTSPALSSQEKSVLSFFSFPNKASEDTAYRQAIRVAQIAAMVADWSGFSMTLKAMKVVYLGSELLQILMKGDILPMLSPLLESLKGFGITGPSALLKLYYLGCHHTLIIKQQLTLPQAPRFQAATAAGPSRQPGCLLSEAPAAVLTYASAYLSAAQYLYLAALPEPYDNSEYTAWYLQQLVKRSGFVVLTAVAETTKLPNGWKCPAFAVMLRDRPTVTGQGQQAAIVEKEVIITIRGSKSTMDWTINAREDVTYYTYPLDQIQTTQAIQTMQAGKGDAAREGDAAEIAGYVHQGIYESCLAMLDGYNLRPYLLLLLQQGYTITCTGHSLGAGVAAMLAAELRKMIRTINDGPSTSTGKAGTGKVASSSSKLTAVNNQLAKSADVSVSAVRAVVYSCPAFLSPTLAAAFLQDRLLMNIVQGYDVIPRFSLQTMRGLAKELEEKTFLVRSGKWANEDQYDLQDYIRHLGKMSELNESTAERRAYRRTLMHNLWQEKLNKKKKNKNKNKDKGKEDKKDKGAATATATATAVAAMEVDDGDDQDGDGGYEDGDNEDGDEEDDDGAAEEAEAIRVLNAVASGGTSTGNNNNQGANNASDNDAGSAAGPASASSNFTNQVNAILQNAPSGLKSFLTPYLTGTKQPTAATTEMVDVSGSSSSTSTAAPVPAAASTTTTTSTMVPPSLDAPVVIATAVPAAPPSKPMRKQQSSSTVAAPTVAAEGKSLLAMPGSEEDLKTMSKEEIVTVTPGPIVQLYQENNGIIKSAILTHEHDIFQRIYVLPEQGLRDHDMVTYRTLLDAARYHRTRNGIIAELNSMNSSMQSQQEAGAGSASNVADPASKYFLDDVLNYGITSSSPLSASLSASPTKSAGTERGVKAASAGNEANNEAANKGGNGGNGAGGSITGAMTHFVQPIIQKLKLSSSKTTSPRTPKGTTSAAYNKKAGTPATSTSSFPPPAIQVQGKQQQQQAPLPIAAPINHSDDNNNFQDAVNSPPPSAYVTATAMMRYDQAEEDVNEMEREDFMNKKKRKQLAAGEEEDDEIEVDEEEEEDEEEETLVTEEWTPCAICELDVTWPYIMHSDASRAIITHSCAACGKVVCTYCAPAGDTVPGDGINKTNTLPDLRISLPWLGIYQPQRVCLHCYFDSSYPGLSMYSK